MMASGYKTKALRYLGGISGEGVITQNGKRLAQASFDLDGYFRAPLGVTGSGQIQAPAAVLKGLFGLPDLQLLTDGGLLLDLIFSGDDAGAGQRRRSCRRDRTIALALRLAPLTRRTAAKRKDGSEIATSLPTAWLGIRAIPLCRRVRRGQRSAADHGVGHRALGRRSLAGSGPHREITEIPRIRGSGQPDPGWQRG